MDGDGVLDENDLCPIVTTGNGRSELENFNGYKDEDGCADSEGVELEVLRGKIDVTFFDREGRSSNSKILLENSKYRFFS